MEVLIALLIAMILLFIVPLAGWVTKVATVGGLGFAIYGLIILVQFLLGKFHPKP